MKTIVLVYCLTYGGAAMALIRPFYGLLVYISFAIVRPEILWRWTLQPGNYSRIVGVAMLIGWAFTGFGDWRFGRAKPIVLAFAGFFLWAFLSSQQAVDEIAAAAFLDNLLKIFLPFLVGMTVIESVEQLKQLTVVVLASTALWALRENEYYYSYGLLVGDNITAHCMSVGAIVAFFSVVILNSWQGKLVGLIALAMCANAVMFHMSRGAMLGVFVAGLAAFYVVEKTRSNVTLFAVAVVIALGLAGPSVVDEFKTSFATADERDESAQSRFDLAADMLQETKSVWLLGLGPRGWPKVAHEYGWPPGKEGHNAWLQLLVETGFPGLACIGAFYGLCVLKLLPAARRYGDEEPSWLEPYAQLVVVGVICWTTQQLVGSFYLVELPYYVVLIGAAALKLASHQTDYDEPDYSVVK